MSGASATDAVFLSRYGWPLSRDHLTWIARRYIASAKLGKSGACHLFRHTMATLMNENGADIRCIRQMLGHADIKTTQIYTQVAIRTLQRENVMHNATGRRRCALPSLSLSLCRSMRRNHSGTNAHRNPSRETVEQHVQNNRYGHEFGTAAARVNSLRYARDARNHPGTHRNSRNPGYSRE